MATPSHQALGPDPGGRPDEPGTGDGRAARQRAPRAGGSLACDAAGRPRRGRLSRAHRGGPAAGLVGPPRSRAHGPVAIAVAVVVAVGDAVLRPALRLLVSRAGAVGALVLGILAQLLVVGGALSLTPGVQSGSVATVVPALLLVALFSTVGRFLLGTGDEDHLVGDLVRRAERRRRRAGDADVRPAGPPGLVVVQIDGVPHPVCFPDLPGRPPVDVLQEPRAAGHRDRAGHDRDDARTLRRVGRPASWAGPVDGRLGSRRHSRPRPGGPGQWPSGRPRPSPRAGLAVESRRFG